MTREQNSEWGLEKRAQCMLSNYVKSRLVVARWTIQRLAVAAQYQGHFKTLDNHIHGRTPWQPKAIEAVIRLISERWLPNVSPEALLESLRKGRPPNRAFIYPPRMRRYELRLRDADTVAQQLRAYEIICRESWTIAARVPTWSLPNKAMSQFHHLATGGLHEQARVLNRFERLRHEHYLFDPHPCRRMLLISEFAFVAFAAGIHPYDLLDSSAVRDSLLLLADLVRRGKLQFDLVRVSETDVQMESLLLGGRARSEITLIGDRFHFFLDHDLGWYTSGVAEGITPEIQLAYRQKIVSMFAKHALHGLKQQQALGYLTRAAERSKFTVPADTLEATTKAMYRQFPCYDLRLKQWL
jgi:hypothetical protein